MSKVVKNYFQLLGLGEVRRYEVPNPTALNFMLFDAQDKTLGQATLEMVLPA
jgi:hypothetical protein